MSVRDDHLNLGTVYVVRYNDGNESRSTYEELLPFICDRNLLQQDVKAALERAKSSEHVKAALALAKSDGDGSPRVCLELGHGVRKDKYTDLFFGVAKLKAAFAATACSNVRSKTCEETFDAYFTSHVGAAVAHDFLVRRMRFVKTPAKCRKTFEELNFPDLSWCDLVGLMLACAANETDFAEAFAKMKATQGAAKAKKQVTPAAKAKPTGSPSFPRNANSKRGRRRPRRLKRPRRPREP